MLHSLLEEKSRIEKTMENVTTIYNICNENTGFKLEKNLSIPWKWQNKRISRLFQDIQGNQAFLRSAFSSSDGPSETSSGGGGGAFGSGIPEGDILRTKNRQKQFPKANANLYSGNILRWLRTARRY